MCGITVVGLALFFLGCAAAPRSLKAMNPFGAAADDESFRKRVEADSFPAAKKAGL